MDMRVDAAPADHVSTRWGDDGTALAGEQRPSEQERCPDSTAELVVELYGVDARRLHTQLVRAGPLHVDPEGGDELEHRLHVADARDVRERHRLGGEEAGGEDRQRPVLVPSGD